MTNWLTPSESSTSQADPTNTTNPTNTGDTQLGARLADGSSPDPSVTSIDAHDVEAATHVADLTPPTGVSPAGYPAAPTTQFPVVEQGYGDSYPPLGTGSTANSMSIVGIVLAAGAGALVVAILLAFFLPHDSIDNRDRLFPAETGLGVIVTGEPTLNPDRGLS